jgi:type II secretory pathway pseudopilin PulG
LEQSLIQGEIVTRLQKRTFTLLELMIALGLTAILLTILFRFFAGSVRMDQKISDARASLYQRQHFQTRISSLCNAIAPRSSLSVSSGSSFYTINEKKPGFVAIFDNGIDPDPRFSGPVLGKVYIDPQSNLMLVLWPLEKTETKLYRTEVLLSGVQSIHFQFLAQKSLQNNDPKATSINSTLEWRTDWPKNRWDIPSIIRITLLHENQEISFAFMLPFIEPIVTYHEPERVG